MDRFNQKFSQLSYFCPDFAASFHHHFNINSLIHDEFTVKSTFVDSYLNRLRDLFDRNITKRFNKRLLMCLLTAVTMQWIYFLFIERNREYQISLGDFTPLMGGNEIYTKFTCVAALVYGLYLEDLIYPSSQSKRKEFKWVELFECTRGNLPPKEINIKEEDGEIMRKGNANTNTTC